MKISVVTVVFNSRAYIEKTIQSVLSQTSKNFEYILIDGGSNDGTLEIIEKYRKDIDFFRSERDNGIYDAMNKGFDLVKGDWVIFLNSGDCFHDRNVLEMAESQLNNGYSIVYGSVEIMSEFGDVIKIIHPLPMKKIFLLMFGTRVVCHQSIFYNKNYFSKYPTDLRLKGELWSYFEGLRKAKAKKVNLIISRYRLGGLGQQLQAENDRETFKVLKSVDRVFWILFLPFYLYAYFRRSFIKISRHLLDLI